MAAEFSPCEVTLKFGDGDYLFRIGLVQIGELEQKCGTGLGEVYARVLAGRLHAPEEIGLPTHARWRWPDLRETVRLGLIGGNSGVVNGQPVTVSAVQALQLVERYLDPIPKQEAWRIAAAVLFACIEGYRAEGKETGNENATEGNGSTTPSRSQTAKSGGSNHKQLDA